MKTTYPYNVLFTYIIMFSAYALNAQIEKNTIPQWLNSSDDWKQQENYLELKKLGYSEKAIYEDLGNAYFLSENYETAIFWYAKLLTVSAHKQLPENYQKRYEFALNTIQKSPSLKERFTTNWEAQVRADYIGVSEYSKSQSQFKTLSFSTVERMKTLEVFVEREVSEIEPQQNKPSPLALSTDGKTAYYSKPVWIKPLYGVLSKKEKVQKIYKAVHEEGRWKSVGELSLAPKNSSAMHPAISEDGSRLFFASDMPGSYGKYDIYVATIGEDGVLGIAKNLGNKVNTKEDDLYPTIMGGTSLFFASNGHRGFGGLDVFMVEVAQNKVGKTVNLGSPINSLEDDFYMELHKDDHTGYVVLRRGQRNGKVQRVGYVYSGPSFAAEEKRREYQVLEALNTPSKINYSSSIFEDQE